MNTTTLKTIARRSLSLAGVASVAVMVLPGVASAAPTGALTFRSAMLSNSKVSVTSPALPQHTNIALSFNTTTANTVRGIKITFTDCPTYGCTPVAPTGGSAAGVTLTSTGGQLGTGWAVSGTPTATEVDLTKAGGSAVTNGGASTINVANYLNPTDFDDWHVTVELYTDTALTVEQDFGATTVNPARALTETGDVAESLHFRVANSISSCDAPTETNTPDPNDPASDLVTLSPTTMTLSGASTGTAQFCADTNAGGGYVVTYADWGLNSYDAHAGFWNGAHEFNVANGFASSPGTEQFGFNLVANTVPSVGAAPSGAAGWTLGTNYNTANAFSYNDGGSAVTLTTTTAPSLATIYTISYVANASSTTPGGTYRAHQMFVCTATF